jgi:regulatory protein
MTSLMSRSASMTSEGHPSWTGDVDLGVRAWVGEPPPDPVAEGPDADPESVARTILLDALTGQARSRQELRERLAKRAVPDALAERLLERFSEVGLVDDAAFARSWVESRQRSRGLARRALAQELRRKGVDEQTARAALEEVDPDDEAETARELVRKKLRAMRGLDRTTATRRLVGMLGRKGYPPGVAFAVVRDELGELPDGDVGSDMMGE